MSHPNVLAVILARGGSKGLPGKHLRPLLGRPVIDYTLDHLEATKAVTRTVVTSDCLTIRTRCEGRGLRTIDRPQALAGDDASVQATVLHALDRMEKHASWRADVVAILYGNVAVRPADLTDRGVAKLIETGCDSVRSFCPVGKWHPGWMSELAGEEGDVVHACRPGSIDRRQDLEPLFLHDGGCLVVSRQSLLRGRTWADDPHAMFGSDRRGIRVEPGDCVEIDALRDLYLAEAVLREREAQPAVRLAA
jgi:N-acylneuraminate cytidylyltransferase